MGQNDLEEVHMKDIHALKRQADALGSEISRFLRDSQYEENEDLSEVAFNAADPEELFLVDELKAVSETLCDVKYKLAYLNRPIIEESVLHLNDSGRFETDDGFCYTSGSLIEFFAEDGRHDAPYWAVSRVESTSEGYYIVGHRDTALDGLRVRRR